MPQRVKVRIVTIHVVLTSYMLVPQSNWLKNDNPNKTNHHPYTNIKLL